jgi:hypothetical protein
MSDREINEMTLLLTAANTMVNIQILDVSKQLLAVNAEHLELFRQYKEETEQRAGNI